jgi:hypothetical protein
MFFFCGRVFGSEVEYTILNVLIAETLRDKLFTTGSVKRVMNWSITYLFCTIILLIMLNTRNYGEENGWASGNGEGLG